MDDLEQLDPQAAAADAAIQDFRKEHGQALYDAGHPEHSRRARELVQLYESRFPEPNVVDAISGMERPADKVDEAATEAMRPLSAAEFEIGQDSQFGINVDQEKYGWDDKLETDARQKFAVAGLNQAQARTVALSYAETLPATFDRDTASSQSTRLLAQEYGTGNVDRVIAGTNRMIRDIAGEDLYRFIGQSGLGAHPRFVGAAVAFAKQRGYFR